MSIQSYIISLSNAHKWHDIRCTFIRNVLPFEDIIYYSQALCSSYPEIGFLKNIEAPFSSYVWSF